MSRRRLVLAGGALLLAVVFACVASTPRSSAAGRHVVLLHGWNGSASQWNTAKAAYEAQGYTVHALPLPRSGGSAGDTLVNADYVQAYLRDRGLTDVKLDAHSLGGMLALTVALVRRDPAVTSVVLRDSGIGGIGCWVVPDLCSTSAVVNAVKAAPASTVPVLNLNSSTAAMPQVDCLRVYDLGHNDFLSNTAVTAAAIGWPEANPCAPAGTPTAPATPTSAPTRTATASPTATPTSTPAPVCTWWERLWGRC